MVSFTEWPPGTGEAMVWKTYGTGTYMGVDSRSWDEVESACYPGKVGYSHHGHVCGTDECEAMLNCTCKLSGVEMIPVEDIDDWE